MIEFFNLHLVNYLARMGRRAKNKQSAPEPLHPKVLLTSKNHGKRKAESESDVDLKSYSKPAKKLKDGKVTTKREATRKRDVAKVSKTHDQTSFSSDSSNGWEDVEGDDLELQTKSRFCCMILLCTTDISMQAFRYHG